MHYLSHRLLSLVIHHVIDVDDVDIFAVLGPPNECALESEEAKLLLIHQSQPQSFIAQVWVGTLRKNGKLAIKQECCYAKLRHLE